MMFNFSYTEIFSYFALFLKLQLQQPTYIVYSQQVYKHLEILSYNNFHAVNIIVLCFFVLSCVLFFAYLGLLLNSITQFE